jgi:hypothetical protein
LVLACARVQAQTLFLTVLALVWVLLLPQLL